MKKNSLILIGILMTLSIFGFAPKSTKTVCAAESLTETNQIHYGEASHVNPIYADVIPEENFCQPPTLYGSSNVAQSVSTTNLDTVIDTLQDAMIGRNTSATITYSKTGALSESFLDEWIEDVMEESDNPKGGDYLRWNYREVNVSYSYTYDAYNWYDYTIYFSFTYYTTAAQEAEVDVAVRNLLNSLEIATKETDYDKIKTIYDYICANVTYDYDNLNNPYYKLQHSAYAAIIHKKAVCQGYASLLYRLLRESDISSRVIAGESFGENHGWNIAKLGNKYYLLDATWDAGETNYSYFLKGSLYFEDHAFWDEYTTYQFKQTYPISSTNYVATNCKHEWSNEYTIDKQPTCKESGQKSKHCIKCNAIKSGSIVYLPTTDHLLGPWMVTVNPTPSTPGTKYRICFNCDFYETINVPYGTWLCDSTGWWYCRYNDTYPANAWEYINGSWYYFNGAGYMVTGWTNLSGTWYYLDGSGAMATGWRAVGGTWYYFNGSGAMVTGWQVIGNVWYYFHGSGAMAANQWVGNYYLLPSGAMATNRWIGIYYVGANGAWIP